MDRVAKLEERLLECIRSIPENDREMVVRVLLGYANGIEEGSRQRAAS